MKKAKKIKKINILLNVLLISMLIVIPNLLISIQRDIEIPIEEKNPNISINTRLPQESPVYYEDTWGQAWGIYVSGDYAYMADGSSGLAVIDVSDPTNPGTPIYEDTTDDAWDVYVSGDYAYVAAEDSGLAVIQVRRSGGAIPFELIIIASVIGGGAVIGVAVVILLRRKRKE